MKLPLFRIAFIFFIFLNTLVLESCAQKGEKPARYLARLTSPKEFDQLKGQPIQEKYGQVEAVKVLWDLKKDRLYFLSSHHYKWHYTFCRLELGYWQNRTVFNQRNYADVSGREYVLGTINHYLGNDLWTLEFSSADDIPVNLMVGVMDRIRPDFFAGPQLKLFLHTQSLVDKYSSWPEPTSFQVARPNDVYGKQMYQPLNCKIGYGYLRLLKAKDLEKAQPGHHEVVVLDGPALEIPPVAGLLTADFQTPLSHLNVLCKNRGTPFAAHKNMANNPQLLALKGQLVQLEVTQDTFFVRPVDLEEAQAAWRKSKPRKVQSLRRNLKVRRLMSMRELSSRSVNLVGGKAANFSVLARLARKSEGAWKVPEGAFAIPFAYYAEHLAASGADSLILDLLSDVEARTDPSALAPRLQAIRKRIKAHPVAPDLLRAVEAKVRSTSPSMRMRFRSSTNAEDIKGFNGAGLYSSKTGIVGDENKPIDKAIRKVWASAWNYRAFQEREYFGLAQEDVAMGILVHRSFPNEHANGVAITKNLYRKGYWGFVINAQLGEVSVVSPPPEVTCDQIICYAGSEIEFFEDKHIIEYVSYSSLTPEKRVLTQAQILLLSTQLAKIKKFYYYSVPAIRNSATSYREFAMDIEFKFDGPNATLYIKQARPYND